MLSMAGSNTKQGEFSSFSNHGPGLLQITLNFEYKKIFLNIIPAIMLYTYIKVFLSSFHPSMPYFFWHSYHGTHIMAPFLGCYSNLFRSILP